MPGNYELAAPVNNGTNEMAAPEMISKAVVQSDVPDDKNKDKEANIEVYDKNQKEEFVTQEINESFYNQVESKVKGRTRLEELKDIMEDWINYNYNEHES